MISIFNIFKIGIGPSSSHTVGPMRAANAFAASLARGGLIERVERVSVDLFGSLALGGNAHGTLAAIILGLEGETPDLVAVEDISARVAKIALTKRLRLAGRKWVKFDERTDMRLRRQEVLSHHRNGMWFRGLDSDGVALVTHDYYSVGGGFVDGPGRKPSYRTSDAISDLPFPFRTAAELLSTAQSHQVAISHIVKLNEQAIAPSLDIHAELLRIWHVMQESTERGLDTDGELPGGLRVQRRAAAIARRLRIAATGDPLETLDWVNAFAMAVNEENAAGGRVVAAPTNGASGLIPAVLHYYVRFVSGASDEGVCRFLLTAGAVGILYQMNASISGALLGCQAEVGVACSMAAAGLVAAQGGSNEQVEHAAEIGMEHHLGLTCDPIAGLVQIPCIERNAIGAVKAINAARLAMTGDGSHRVSLDEVIATMKQTGGDMSESYKETSLAGLAVNVLR